MKNIKKSSFLFIAATLTVLVMLLLFTESSFAESKKFTEKCYYNGDRIVSDYNSDEFASTIKHMEPGDTLDYTIRYTNKSDETTLWYFRDRTLKTLEESKDQAENGGYTYVLKNGDEVLFSNKEVGGEKVVNKLQGLKQATNATENFFFVQELEPGASQKTHLHVELDGETGVNDYMDTDGALLLTYAVEKKSEASHSDPTTRSRIRTGDMNRIIYYVVLFGISIILLVLAVIFWLRDRKRGEDA